MAGHFIESGWKIRQGGCSIEGAGEENQYAQGHDKRRIRRLSADQLRGERISIGARRGLLDKIDESIPAKTGMFLFEHLPAVVRTRDFAFHVAASALFQIDLDPD